MDAHLRENNRSYLSSLMITGLWIEGLYLATQVAKEYPASEISERIGEQKIILADILNVLNLYNKDTRFKALIEDLENLNTDFKKIDIKYESGEPEPVEKDGMIVFIQHEKSIVNIENEQLNNIIDKTEKIRNKLIGEEQL